VVSFLLAFPSITYMHSSSPPSGYMPCHSHLPRLDHSNLYIIMTSWKRRYKKDIPKQSVTLLLYYYSINCLNVSNACTDVISTLLQVRLPIRITPHNLKNYYFYVI
jgi:hypothetical protein